MKIKFTCYLIRPYYLSVLVPATEEHGLGQNPGQPVLVQGGQHGKQGPQAERARGEQVFAQQLRAGETDELIL